MCAPALRKWKRIVEAAMRARPRLRPRQERSDMATPVDAKRPIIIIKKKGGHGGHHGGAWKVAYADFVTAMMALFIVLWLLSSSSKETQVAISGYFKDPSGTANKAGSALAGTGENIQLAKDDMAKLKEKLQSTI